MVRHVVEQYLHAAPMKVGDKRVKFRQRAEHRIDIGIVTDVIAEIGHWRGINRRDPHSVDAELCKIVKLAANPLQVANTIVVAVFERTWIDLIDDAALPLAEILRPRLRARVKRRHDLSFRKFALSASRSSQRSI